MKRYEWLGTAPEYTDSEINETLQTDIVVCGAGIAGVAAVRTAAEAGAECVLLEKCAKPQGRSGQFAVIGGKLLGRWNIDNRSEAEEIVSALMMEGRYQIKQSILNAFVRRIGADFDWYLDGLPRENLFVAEKATDIPPQGTKFHLLLMQHPVQPNYHREKERFPVFPYTVQIRPSHVPVLRNNLSIAEKTGHVKAFFNTPVKKLLRDGTEGRVYGVIAQDEQGRLLRVLARKGVILATGDYAGNAEMVEALCPDVADNPRLPCGVTRDGKPANTGDGQRMGMWIGAKLETSPHAPNAHNMGTAIGVTPFLQLNLDGHRFMNEDCPGHMVEKQISMQRGKMSWQIFDAAWPEEIPYMPVGHGTCSQVLDDAAISQGLCFNGLLPFDGYALQSFIDKSVEKGTTVRAETLEELIEKTGLPKEPALAEIARYNENARKKMDPDFGKTGCRMFPLENGPFYASKITSAPLLCCHGGLESDEEAHCFDSEMRQVPGLYVAGNVQGNRFAVAYPTALPGLSHSLALTYGRIAGENCTRML